MPLITAAVLAYASGLLTGFGGALLWTVAGAVAAVWWGGRTRRDRLALAALAAAGFVIAATAVERQARCFDRIATQRAWPLVLAADASPGAFVLARHACGIRVRLAVADGSAPAGARVAVSGSATRSRGSLLVTDARLVQLEPPGVFPRWRRAVGRGLDARFGEHGPLVRALLIAEMHDLSPTLRQRFAAAGLSHMLSVSGLHVGIISTAMLLLAQIAGLRPTLAHALVVGLTALYVAAIGAPLPAVRAAAMLAVASLSTTLQRPTSPWAALAVGALLPILAPTSLLDLGYQLSIVGMVALVAAGTLGRRWAWLAVGGWQGALRRNLAVSTVATAFTAPLVAATFGTVSLVAPVSNLVATPLVAVLQPMLFLAALVLPFPGLGAFVADACIPLLAGFDLIATHAARLPGATVGVVTDATAIALACAATTALVVAIASRFPRRALFAAGACLLAIAWRPLIPARVARTEFHMLDVGQGDAVALRTTRNRWVVFDAGREWASGDAGARDVVPYIAERRGRLVAFVLSHPHADHVGGAASTVRALRPTWYYDPGFAGPSGSYRRSLLAARGTGTRWRRVRPGDSLVVDEAIITFLAPDSAWAAALDDPNDASSVARVRVGEVVMLLTGDAEAGEEAWLVAHQREQLRADILKVAHHGSETSSTAPFLRAVRPRLALVSVGAGNLYGHPSPDVMRALAASGAIALRTDLLGTIVVRTDGRDVEVDAANERWRLNR